MREKCKGCEQERQKPKWLLAKENKKAVGNRESQKLWATERETKSCGH